MKTPFSIIWIVIVILLSIASFSGGDTAILAGWLYLIWTAPFGVVWWFYIYDHALTLAPANIIQPVGVAVVDIIAFLFWFVAFPKLRKMGSKKR